MIRKIKNLLHNRVAKNAGWLVAGKIAQMAISLVIGVLTSRYLGPSNYGLINYAGAYTAFFASICTLGINSVIVKELVDQPERDGEIVGTSLVLRALSSFFSALTIVAISLVVDANEPTTQVIVALCAISCVFQIFDTFNYWFQAKMRSKTTAIATFVAYTITALYKAILLIAGKPVTYFAFAMSVDYICMGVLLLIGYRKHGGGRLKCSFAYGAQLLKKSYHFILPGLMVAVYAQTDKIMLKQMLTEAEVGYYSTAVSLCNMWCFVLSAIIDSLYPPIMDAFKKSKEEFDKKNKLLYAIVFYLSVTVSLLLTFFGSFVINVLYGEAYAPAVAPLQVVTWYTAFSYLGVARNAWIVCMKKQKYLKYIYCSAAIINVILNFLFIPLWGATGAAVASLTTQILTVIVVPFFIRELRENSVLMVKAVLVR